MGPHRALGIQTMVATVFDNLLSELRDAYLASDALTSFLEFPDELSRQKMRARSIPSTGMLVSETGLFTDKLTPLRDALIAAAPAAWWRLTYEDTDIGQDFLDRFGCYCIIGKDAPFTSQHMRAWMVYMPPHLHYPWHHHPAEEMYLIVAGEAEFMRAGEANETLRAGDTCFHASNQSHAMETFDHPVMAVVVWRNDFDTLPELTVG